MITDPVERVIAAALDARGVRYVVSKEIYALDFDLPDLGCKIECKQFFSPRAAAQLSLHQLCLFCDSKAQSAMIPIDLSMCQGALIRRRPL